MRSVLQFFFRAMYRKYQSGAIPLPNYIIKAANCINTLSAKMKYGSGYIPIETYDGSSQITHPEIIRFKDDKYLVATPYPYGCEAFENPCLYKWINNNWSLSYGPFCQPLVKGDHFSDPTMVVFNEELYIYYRKTERRNKKDIIFMTKSKDAINWSEPKDVITVVQNAILSPSIVVYNDAWYMYSVRLLGNKNSQIEVRKSKDGIKWGTPEVEGVSNMPTDGYPWHLSVYPNWGMILLIKSKNMHYKGIYYLSRDETWTIREKIGLPFEGRIRNPYKSAYDFEEKKVIVPFRDYNDRWFLYELDWRRQE